MHQLNIAPFAFSRRALLERGFVKIHLGEFVRARVSALPSRICNSYARCFHPMMMVGGAGVALGEPYISLNPVFSMRIPPNRMRREGLLPPSGSRENLIQRTVIGCVPSRH